MPQDLLGPENRPADDYVCVRKLHTYSGEPFCYVEIYVPTAVFESLPSDVAKKRKLLAAVLDDAGRALQARAATHDRHARGLPGLRHAEDPVRLARREDVAAAASTARATCCTPGVTWYRGDRFVSEIDIPVSALKTVPGITEPQPRAIARKRG